MKVITNPILVLGLLIFSIVGAADGEAADYAVGDSIFKRANLTRLAPYGPDFNREQEAIWARFIYMAAKYQDYEIVRRMFDIRDRVDGSKPTRYAKDLLQLYQARPAFFVQSADKYFRGDYTMIFAVWFDGTGEVSLIDLQGPAKRAQRNRLVQRFMKAADSADQRMMSMN